MASGVTHGLRCRCSRSPSSSQCRPSPTTFSILRAPPLRLPRLSMLLPQLPETTQQAPNALSSDIFPSLKALQASPLHVSYRRISYSPPCLCSPCPDRSFFSFSATPSINFLIGLLWPASEILGAAPSVVHDRKRKFLARRQYSAPFSIFLTSCVVPCQPSQ